VTSVISGTSAPDAGAFTTERNVMPDRSGNVTAQHENPRPQPQITNCPMRPSARHAATPGSGFVALTPRNDSKAANRYAAMVRAGDKIAQRSAPLCT
jgi:hypothetical protein